MIVTQNLNKGNSCVPVTPMAIGAQPENGEILFLFGQKVLFIIAHMLYSLKAYVSLSPVSCKGKSKQKIQSTLTFRPFLIVWPPHKKGNATSGKQKKRQKILPSFTINEMKSSFISEI